MATLRVPKSAACRFVAVIAVVVMTAGSAGCGGPLITIDRSGDTSGLGVQRPAKDLKLSSDGAAFIADFEQFRATPYYDGSAGCTIGYGHLIHRGRCVPADATTWGTITEAKALSMFKSAVENVYAAALRKAHPDTPLSQQQFDALVSWIYNAGTGVAGKSNISRDLAAHPVNYAAIPTDFKAWIYSKGKKVCGLYRRAVSEGNLFRTGSYSRLNPPCP